MTTEDGNEFKKILVPVDGSKHSNKAVIVAASLARRFRAKITLLNVVGLPNYAFAAEPTMPVMGIPEFREYARREANVILDSSLSLASGQGVEADCEVIENAASVVESIADFAKNEDCDLIVIGTRGRSGFKKMVLGSVSSGVVSHAHCPVLVVR